MEEITSIHIKKAIEEKNLLKAFLTFLVGNENKIILNFEEGPSINLTKEKSVLQVQIDDEKYVISIITYENGGIVTEIFRDLTGLAVLLSVEGEKTVTLSLLSSSETPKLVLKIFGKDIVVERIGM